MRASFVCRLSVQSSGCVQWVLCIDICLLAYSLPHLQIHTSASYHRPSLFGILDYSASSQVIAAFVWCVCRVVLDVEISLHVESSESCGSACVADIAG